MDIANTFNLPKDIVSGCTIISWIGQKEAYIENFKNIIEYNDCLIKLKVKDAFICITGKHLLIESFGSSRIIVKGYIKEIKYV